VNTGPDVNDSDPGVGPATSGASPDAIDVYWRRGCGFCAVLIRRLERTGLPVRMHDIWADPDAAATVRVAAGGNETVPTVGLDGEFLVNPSLDAVIDLVARRAPHLID